MTLLVVGHGSSSFGTARRLVVNRGAATATGASRYFVSRRCRDCRGSEPYACYPICWSASSSAALSCQFRAVSGKIDWKASYKSQGTGTLSTFESHLEGAIGISIAVLQTKNHPV